MIREHPIDEESSVELEGWEEIKSKADADPIAGKQAGATVRAAEKLVFAISALQATIRRENRFTRTAIEQAGNDMKSGTEGLNKSIKELNQHIADFNEKSTELGRKANKLILWYVVLTGVIALATVVSLFLPEIRNFFGK